MKKAKKFLVGLLAFASVSAFAFGVVGCDNNKTNTGTGGKPNSGGANGVPALQYTLSDDGTYYSVTGIGSCADTALIIPETYNNLPITTIAEYALTGQVFTSVTIPNSITEIGNWALGNCDNLTEITIPGSVATMGESIFYGCGNLTSATIENGITTIADQMFYDCNNLTSVTIPTSVTGIGRSAFLYCNGLKNVYYTGDVADWCNIVFDEASENPLSFGADLYIDGEKTTSIVIPDTVTNIGDYAFYGANFTGVTIGSLVTAIGTHAFEECYFLAEVYNKSALNIALGQSGNGYVGNYALTIHTEPYESKISTDNNGYILYTDDEEKIIVGYTGKETQLNLPTGATGIKCYAFAKREDLTSVSLPESLRKIGRAAFKDCKGLTEIIIPDQVITIGGYAFDSCMALTNVTIGEAVATIEERAFQSCTGLESIMISTSVNFMGTGAFNTCVRLEEILYKGTSKQWSQITIEEANDDLKNTKRYYYTESSLTGTGRYWRYENGEIVKWEQV
ncbi:MAG: leucine-rich repeat domain-containing protein [Clostridiales bacterium]|nr:leucine-rich repeat domain-containing protein [Clostridiales bacterium]